MADFEAEIDNLYLQMENFLRAVARREPTPSHPIYLRTEYKNSLKLIDKSKHQFSVEESFLSAFRDVYTDKSCTHLFTQSRRCVCTAGNSNWSSRARGAKKYH